jgi:hypothetical protein
MRGGGSSPTTKNGSTTHQPPLSQRAALLPLAAFEGPVGSVLKAERCLEAAIHSVHGCRRQATYDG